jgi:hypothetical protein
MFARRFAPSLSALLIAGLVPCTLPMADARADATVPLPSVTATLYITHQGNGYYLVVVSGQSTAANASCGVRVRGDDPWFDDALFSMGVGYARTDFTGRFNISQVVYRSLLNEDPEGRDEVYAIAEVSGAGSARTNTIEQYF